MRHPLFPLCSSLQPPQRSELGVRPAFRRRCLQGGARRLLCNARSGCAVRTVALELLPTRRPPLLWLRRVCLASMRPSLSDVCDDISRAKQQFKVTASQQRKLLVSGGLEAPRASLQLMDQLIQHRLGSGASCSSDDALPRRKQPTNRSLKGTAYLPFRRCRSPTPPLSLPMLRTPSKATAR